MAKAGKNKQDTGYIDLFAEEEELSSEDFEETEDLFPQEKKARSGFSLFKQNKNRRRLKKPLPRLPVGKSGSIRPGQRRTSAARRRMPTRRRKRLCAPAGNRGSPLSLVLRSKRTDLPPLLRKRGSGGDGCLYPGELLYPRSGKGSCS